MSVFPPFPHRARDLFVSAVGAILLALAVVPAPASAHSQGHGHRQRQRAEHHRAKPALARLARQTEALDRAPATMTLAFTTPLPGHGVNSRFGLRQLSFEPQARQHDGVDIAAPAGAAVRVAAMGFVRREGVSESYGNWVEIAHADGLSTFYAHMLHGAKLRPGAFVMPGAVVGFVGSTGHSTGPHLHFEVRRQGAPLNPMLFMGRKFAAARDLPAAPARIAHARADPRAWRTYAALHGPHGAAKG